MKIIGLLGGMSWESTSGYYRIINEGVNTRLGGLHSAEIVMYSVDFDPIEKFQQTGDWDAMGKIMADTAKCIESAGADVLLICSNTMHKVAPEVEQAVHIPLLHIADATAEVLIKEGIRTVGLLGTAFTMEQDFYRGKLRDDYGLSVLVPEQPERDAVHRIIYEELCLGETRLASKAELLRIVDQLASRGAEGIILGCTEIGLLINQSDTDVKLFDTTLIHADKAVEYATRGRNDCR